MIKAIETQYKGYRFRSRLEARWAVVFDKLGIEWEYEKEGFDLGMNGYYLPDFWLPWQQCYVEIKPELNNEILTMIPKLESLSRMTGHWCNIFSGNVGSQEISGARMGHWKGNDFRLTICVRCNNLTIADRVYRPYVSEGIYRDIVYSHCYKCDGVFHNSRSLILNNALYAGRSARFEHGESGYQLR